MISEQTWKNALIGEAFKRGVILWLCRGHFCVQFLSLEGINFMTWHFIFLFALFYKARSGQGIWSSGYYSMHCYHELRSDSPTLCVPSAIFCFPRLRSCHE